MDSIPVQELLEKFLSNSLSDQELESFRTLLGSAENKEAFETAIGTILAQDRFIEQSYGDRDAIFSAIIHEGYKTSIQEEKAPQTSTTLFSPRSLTKVAKLRWASVAAAIIIFFGLGTYLWLNHNSKTSVAIVNPTIRNDVAAPVATHAILTLADGRKVALDSAVTGMLALQENIPVLKQVNGQIVYDSKKSTEGGNRNGDIAYNILTVPRGSQIAEIVLADGTHVWLNAASSIKYPVAFTGKERRVEISGEAYFEVTKNIRQPFIVQSPTDAITVLGTHFNVNAYADEPAVTTTLLEGSVRIGKQILKPDEAYSNGLIRKADVEQAVAWKNGKFQFGAGMDITAILRQVSRWYDVDIKYEGTIRGTIGGTLSKKANVSTVLDLLQSTGTMNYSIQGKQVTVSPVK